MTDLDQLAAAALDVPLARALGCRLLDPERPETGAWFEAGELAGNGVGGVHASAYDVLLELAGFLAVAPSLAEDEHAVTIASSASLIGAASTGDRVEARGTLERRTHRLAFVSVAVTGADEVLVRAQLTKSVAARR